MNHFLILMVVNIIISLYFYLTDESGKSVPVAVIPNALLAIIFGLVACIES